MKVTDERETKNKQTNKQTQKNNQKKPQTKDRKQQGGTETIVKG